jgi:ATP-dependent DNA helicase PIF1
MIKGLGSTKEKEAIVIPPGFQMDEDLSAAYDAMENTGETFFLTGRAGTGKSTLLNYFRKNTKKKYVVLAPTGLAALQVGGTTIHSFFGFPLRTLVKADPGIRPWSKGHPKMRLIKNVDALIIDEVSMVRADILDGIDQSLRLNLGVDIPFGGKQLIFIGDVFQLPPVTTAEDLSSLKEDEYYDPYFFSAEAFLQCKPRIIELKKIYRQQDEDFIYLLNRIRMGIADEGDLEVLNERYSIGKTQEEFAITLSTINSIADLVNIQKLAEISSLSHFFEGKEEGSFDERHYPAPKALQLKRGAQVMMIKNDLKGRWVNGSIGKVEDVSDDEIIVRFSNGQLHRVEKVVWENKVYTWDRASHTIDFTVMGTYTQYPIRLAWAITIHKSQGLTFDKVIIELGKGAFAHGQLYVALSRCKTLEGITLRSKVNLKDLIVDETVERFASKTKIR